MSDGEDSQLTGERELEAVVAASIASCLGSAVCRAGWMFGPEKSW